jgi:predicted  nucleic acid-binding Zn-ribbon protein
MADAVHREPATGIDDGSRRTQQLEAEIRMLTERAAQAERELRAAKAEVEVKDEYVTSLEAELDETLVFLRAKTAYIESRPSVRLKLWVKGLRHRSR